MTTTPATITSRDTTSKVIAAAPPRNRTSSKRMLRPMETIGSVVVMIAWTRAKKEGRCDRNWRGHSGLPLADYMQAYWVLTIMALATMDAESLTTPLRRSPYVVLAGANRLWPRSRSQASKDSWSRSMSTCEGWLSSSSSCRRFTDGTSYSHEVLADAGPDPAIVLVRCDPYLPQRVAAAAADHATDSWDGSLTDFSPQRDPALRPACAWRGGT
jgi:hypothetical protein